MSSNPSSNPSSSPYSSAPSRNGTAGSFPIEIVARATGLDQVTLQITRFSTALKNAGTIINQQMAAIRNAGSAFNSFVSPLQKSQTTLEQYMNIAKNSANVNTMLANSAKTTAASFQQESAAMNTLMGNAERTAAALNQTVGAERNLITANEQATASAELAANASINQALNTEKATLAINQAAVAEKNLVTSNEQAAVALGTANNAINTETVSLEKNALMMRNAIAQTRMYDAALMSTNVAVEEAALVSNAHTTSSKENSQAILNNMRHVSGLAIAFMALSSQQAGSSEVQGNIRMQTEKVAEAQKKYNEAVKQFGKDSHQAQQALSAWTKDQRGLAFEQREANSQLHNQMFMYTLMAVEIMHDTVPSLLHMKETTAKVKAGFTSLQGVISSMPTKMASLATLFGGIGNALSAIPSKLRGTAIESVKTGGALANLESHTSRSGKSLDALGNIALASGGRFARLSGILLKAAPPLIAIAVATALVSVNFMGVRDKLEAFGLQLGNTIPILAPFLEGLQGIAAKLGLTGESADQAKKHLDNAGRGFANLSTLWNDTVANMQSSNNRLVKAMGDTASVLSRDFVKAGNDLSNQLKATINTWNQFVAALGRGDYKTATDLIIKSFESIPSIIGTAFSNLGTIVSNAFIGLGNTLGPAIMGIGTELGNRLIQGLLASWAYITNIVNSAVIVPIQNAFNTLYIGIKPIADLVWNKLGLTNLIQTAITLMAAIGSTFMNIVNFAKDIQTEVWNKLGLAGLVTAAYNLGQAVWNNIVAGINAAGAAIGSLVNPSSNKANAVSSSSGFDQNTLDYETNKHNKAVQDALAAQTKQSTGQALNTSKGAKFGPPKPLTPITSSNNTNQSASSSIVTPKAGQTPGLASTGLGSHPSNFVGGSTPTTQHSNKTSQQLMSPPVINATTSALDKQREALNKLNDSVANNAKGQSAAAKAGYTWLAEQTQIIPVTKTYTQDLTDLASSVGPLVEQNTKMEDSLRGNALAMKQGFLQTLLFKQGVLEQKQALQEAQMEVIKTSGTLQEYSNQIMAGTIQQTAFDQGVQQVHKEFLDMVKDTANMTGQLAGYSMALTSATAQQIEYNNGLVSGALETTKMIVEMDRAKGEFVGTRTVLQDVAQSMGLMTNSTRLSNEAMQQFIGVIKGAPDAVKKLVDSFTEFSSSAISSVADAFKKGGKAVKDEIKKIEEELGRKLTAPEKKMITVEAKTENAKNRIHNDIDLALRAAVTGFPQAFGKSVDDATKIAKENFKKGTGEMKQIWGQVMQDLSNIKGDPLGSKQLIDDIGKLNADLSKLGDSGDKAKLTIQGIGSASGQYTAVVDAYGNAIGGTGTQAQQADPQLQKYFTTLSQFGNIEAAAQTIFEQVIPALIANVAVALNTSFKQGTDDAIGYMHTLNDNTIEVFSRIVQGLDPVLQAFNTQFQAAQQNATDQMHTLSDNTIEAFSHIVEGLDPLLQAFDTTFSTAQTNETEQMRTLSDNTIEAFMRITEGLGIVAGAFDDMTSRASSAMDSVVSSADRATSAVDRLKSAIDSLQNKTVTITTVYKTVGSKSKAGQFGLSMTVDKPTHFLAGEGNSPERVKISNGFMPFLEDFRQEMTDLFRGKRVQQGNDDSGSQNVTINQDGSNQNISIQRRSNTGSGVNINQSQSSEQSSSVNNNDNNNNNQSQTIVSSGDVTNQGNNVNIQSDSRSQNNVSGSSVPMPSRTATYSYNGSNDSHSTELHRNNYSMMRTRVLHETPLEIDLNIDGQRLVKKIIRLVTEELNNAGVYG